MDKRIKEQIKATIEKEKYYFMAWGALGKAGHLIMSTKRHNVGEVFNEMVKLILSNQGLFEIHVTQFNRVD